MSLDVSPIALAPPKLRVLTTKQRSRPSGREIARLLVPAMPPLRAQFWFGRRRPSPHTA
jgi:hypothetical protein